MRMCDFSVQFYDAEEALIRRFEAPDNPCVHVRDADQLKRRHDAASPYWGATQRL